MKIDVIRLLLCARFDRQELNRLSTMDLRAERSSSQCALALWCKWIALSLWLGGIAINAQPLPEPPTVLFQGWQHTGVGQAGLTVGPNGLRISNLGSSGRDGVLIDFQERVRVATFGFDAIDFAPRLTGQLTVFAAGTLGGVPGRILGSSTLTWQSNQVAVNLQAGSGLSNGSFRLEAYHNGALTGTADFATDGPIGRLPGNVAITSFTIGQPDFSRARWSLWEIKFANVVPFSTSQGILNGTRFRFLPHDAAGGLQNLETVGLTGRNISSMLVTQEDAPAFQPKMTSESTGTNVVFRWDTRNAALQSTPQLTGPWMERARGVNSFKVVPQQRSEFFRLSVSNALELAAHAPRRNVLLIIADDVGIDQLPIYIQRYAATARTDDDILVDTNSPTVLTPTITQLAGAGVTFLNACSSPTCSPTRAGLFTGKRSFRHLVYDPARPNLPFTETTIAQVLSPSGYLSGLFGKWHLGDPGAIPPGQGPVDFGWERHYGALEGALSTSYTNWHKVENTIAFTSTNHATMENVTDALAWIQARGTSNWMATVAFNAPHWVSGGGKPIHLEMPPAAYRVRVDDGGRATYRSMLEHLDIQLARLLAGIDASVLEKTTVIFVGDNGTDSELGVNYHFSRSHSKGTLYEGSVNVPLVIADGYAFVHREELPFPLPSTTSSRIGRVNWPGRFNTNLVQTMDIFATVAAIAGGDASSGLDSISLIPYLRNIAAAPQRTNTLAETRTVTWTECGNNGWNIAIRNATHKLHVRNYGPVNARYELYDLSVDRWERLDIWTPANAALVAIRDTLLAAVDAQFGSAACP